MEEWEASDGACQAHTFPYALTFIACRAVCPYMPAHTGSFAKAGKSFRARV